MSVAPLSDSLFVAGGSLYVLENGSGRRIWSDKGSISLFVNEWNDVCLKFVSESGKDESWQLRNDGIKMIENKARLAKHSDNGFILKTAKNKSGDGLIAIFFVTNDDTNLFAQCYSKNMKNNGDRDNDTDQVQYIRVGNVKLRTDNGLPDLNLASKSENENENENDNKENEDDDINVVDFIGSKMENNPFDMAISQTYYDENNRNSNVSSSGNSNDKNDNKKGNFNPNLNEYGVNVGVTLGKLGKQGNDETSSIAANKQIGSHKHGTSIDNILNEIGARAKVANGAPLTLKNTKYYSNNHRRFNKKGSSANIKTRRISGKLGLTKRRNSNVIATNDDNTIDSKENNDSQNESDDPPIHIIRNAVVAMIGIGKYDNELMSNVSEISKDYQNMIKLFVRDWNFSFIFNGRSIMNNNNHKNGGSNKNEYNVNKSKNGLIIMDKVKFSQTKKPLDEQFVFKTKWTRDDIDSFVKETKNMIENNRIKIDINAFIFIISGHGDSDRMIFETNGDQYPLTRLYSQFVAKNCHKLCGKPKLFFVDSRASIDSIVASKVEGFVGIGRMASRGSLHSCSTSVTGGFGNNITDYESDNDNNKGNNDNGDKESISNKMDTRMKRQCDENDGNDDLISKSSNDNIGKNGNDRGRRSSSKIFGVAVNFGIFGNNNKHKNKDKNDKDNGNGNENGKNYNMNSISKDNLTDGKAVANTNEHSLSQSESQTPEYPQTVLNNENNNENNDEKENVKVNNNNNNNNKNDDAYAIDEQLKISSNSYLETINLLLQHGIDPNIQNKYGYTALHQVLLHMPEQLLYVSIMPLIKHPKINVNCQNLFGCTALHECIIRLRLQSVKILLDCGANMYINENNGIKPIDLTHNHIIIEQLIANQITKNAKNVKVLKGETTDMCDVCGKRSDIDVKKLFLCEACHSRKYCSKKCQKYDWKLGNHKTICKQLKKENEIDKTNEEIIIKNDSEHNDDSKKMEMNKHNDSELEKMAVLKFIVKDRIFQEKTNNQGVEEFKNTEIMPIREQMDGMMNQVLQFQEMNVFGNSSKEHIERLQGIKNKTDKHITKARNNTKNIINGKDLLKAPNGKYGIENKFIVKIQCSRPQYTNPILKAKIEKNPNRSIYKFEYASDSMLTVYNHQRTYIGFIIPNIQTSENANINKKNKKKRAQNNRKIKKGKKHNNVNCDTISNQAKMILVGKKEQNDNFDKLVEIIQNQGWQKYKIYCYAFVDENNVLHVLQNQLVAHQRW